MALTRVENKETVYQKVRRLSDELDKAAVRTVNQLEKLVNEDGSYTGGATDIACYYKSPMMFLTAGNVEYAKIILGYIKSNFLMEGGDFKTTRDIKSVKPEYSEYYTYINGWITRAANLSGDHNLKHDAYRFAQQFYQDGSFFLTNRQCHHSDVLTIAHCGLLNLELGNKTISLTAGDQLSTVLQQQDKSEDGFYLRVDESRKLVRDFDTGMSLFYYVSSRKPNQLYFMVGYPCAYLSILYKETHDEKYLVAAKGYFEFALKCGDNIFQSMFSHKLAWAASLLFQITEDERYLTAIEKIASYFISTQDKDGMWLASEGSNTSLDQSAEIACWFMNIKDNLNDYIKKHSLDLKSADSTSTFSIKM